MPTVSGIITTFNRAEYLKKAIKSALSQTYRDFELLILDNSSTDGSEAIIHHFNDSRIRYIKHRPLNISQTRNLGVYEAKGDFIAFLDDDDEWLPHKLQSEFSLFEKSANDIAMIYGGFIRIDGKGNAFYTHQPSLKGKILKALLSLEDDFTGSASNPMIKKSAIESLGGFDESIKTGEDWEFYLRLTERYSVAFVSHPIVKIRHHFGARLGDKLKDYIDLETKIMVHYKNFFEQDPILKSFYLQRIGGKYLRLGERRRGRENLIAAIKCNVPNFLAYIQFVLSFLPTSVYGFAHKWYLNQKRSIKI